MIPQPQSLQTHCLVLSQNLMNLMDQRISMMEDVFSFSRMHLCCAMQHPDSSVLQFGLLVTIPLVTTYKLWDVLVMLTVFVQALNNSFSSFCDHPPLGFWRTWEWLPGLQHSFLWCWSERCPTPEGQWFCPSPGKVLHLMMMRSLDTTFSCLQSMCCLCCWLKASEAVFCGKYRGNIFFLSVDFFNWNPI